MGGVRGRGGYLDKTAYAHSWQLSTLTVAYSIAVTRIIYYPLSDILCAINFRSVCQTVQIARPLLQNVRLYERMHLEKVGTSSNSKWLTINHYLLYSADIWKATCS